MATRTPNTDLSNVLGRALHAVNHGISNEFYLRRLEQDAVALSTVDEADALEVRAHISAIRDDGATSDDLYDQALGCTNDLPGAVVRYLILLASSGRGMEACEVANDYQCFLDEHSPAWRAAAEALGGSGWTVVESGIKEKLRKLKSSSSEEGSLDPMDILDPRGVDASDITDPTTFARRFLREAARRDAVTRRLVVPGENGNNTLLLEFSVNVSAGDLGDLERKMLSALAQQEFPAIEQKLVTLSLTILNEPSDPDLPG